MLEAIQDRRLCRRFRLYPLFDEETGRVPSCVEPVDIDIDFERRDSSSRDAFVITNVTIDGRAYPYTKDGMDALADVLVRLGYDFKSDVWLRNLQKAENGLAYIKRRMPHRMRSLLSEPLERVPESLVSRQEKDDLIHRYRFAWAILNDSDARVRDVAKETLNTLIDDLEAIERQTTDPMVSARMGACIRYLANAVSVLNASQYDTIKLPYNGKTHFYVYQRTNDGDRMLARVSLAAKVDLDAVAASPADAREFYEYVLRPIDARLIEGAMADADVRRFVIDTLTRIAPEKFFHPDVVPKVVDIVSRLGPDAVSCRWLMESLRRSVKLPAAPIREETSSMIAALGRVAPPEMRDTVLDFLDDLEAGYRNFMKDGRTLERILGAFLTARYRLGVTEVVREAIDNADLRAIAIELSAKDERISDGEKSHTFVRILAEEIDCALDSDGVPNVAVVSTIAHWFASNGRKEDIVPLVDIADTLRNLRSSRSEAALTAIMTVGGIDQLIHRTWPEMPSDMRKKLRKAIHVFQRTKRFVLSTYAEEIAHFDRERKAGRISQWAPDFLVTLLESHALTPKVGHNVCKETLSAPNM